MVESIRIGLSIRALRRRRGWTQQQLGERCGASGSTISRIERGGVADASLAFVERVLAVLGARISIRILWQGEELDRLLDRGHAAIVERMLIHLGRAGWLALPEATFQIHGERGSVDVLAWHAAAQTVLVVEVKTVVPDVQAMLAALDRKARLAPTMARQRGWSAEHVGRVLVLPDDRTARRRIAAFGATFARALPSRTVEVKRWIAAPTGSMNGVLFMSDLPAVQARQRVRRRTDAAA